MGRELTDGGGCVLDTLLTERCLGNVELLEAVTACSEVLQRYGKPDHEVASEFHTGFFRGTEELFLPQHGRRRGC